MAERRLGAALRKMRNERALTLAQISKRLHIKASFLDAIERGESDALFPRAYLTGYVRSYARLLEVDIAADLDELAAELRREREETVPAFEEPETRLRRAPLWLAVGGAAIVGIFLYGLSAGAPPAALQSDDPQTMAAEAAAPAIATAEIDRAPEAVPAPVAPMPEAQTPPAPDPIAPMAVEPRLEAAVEERPAVRTKVVTKSVYLRAKPSNEAAPIATIMRCAHVTVGDALKSGWVEVKDGPGSGYLYRTFLKDTVPSCGGDVQASR